MRKILVNFVAMMSCLWLAGCGPMVTPVSSVLQLDNIDFINSNSPKKVKIGEFTYTPQQKLGLQQNQIQFTVEPFNYEVFFDIHIADLVKKITIQELKKSGFYIADNTDIAISADIREYSVDISLSPIPFTQRVNRTYVVLYSILRMSSNTTIYSKEYKATLNTRSMASQRQILLWYVQIIKDGYNLFAQDPEVQEILAVNTLSDNKPADELLQATTSSEVVDVTPASLWKAFNENEVAAEDTYKGKVVNIKGAIKSIMTNSAGNPQVSFTVGRNVVHEVQCEFSKDARGEIGKLKKAQNVSIIGVCQGLVAGNVLIKNSKVID